MPVAFWADKVSAWEEDEKVGVTFSSGTGSEEARLEFERANGDKSDPVMLCVNTPFAPLPGIIEILLTPTRLVITHPDHSGRSVALVVGFKANGKQLNVLRIGLKRVFRRTGIFVDDAATGRALIGAIIAGPPTPTSELLVVPFYMTVVGITLGGVVAGVTQPLLIPLGVVAGAPLGFIIGYLKRGRFYGLHKYR